MTEAVVDPISVYALTGTTTGPFATSWGYEAAAEVQVWIVTVAGVQTLLTSGSGYTLTPGAVTLDDGGSVTLAGGTVPVGGWTTGDKVALIRATPVSQPEPLGDRAAITPSTVEAAINRVVRQAQDSRRDLNRGIKVPLGEAGLTVAAAATRAGKMQEYDGTGASKTDRSFTDILNQIAVLLGLDQLLSSLAPSANKLAYFISATEMALTDLVSQARSFLADPSAAYVNFLQAGTGAVVRTLQAAGRDIVSVKDFKDAAGGGSVDDTTAFNLALASGTACLVVPPGTYITTGLVITSGSALKQIIGIGRPVVQLVAAAGRIALDVQKAQYFSLDGVDFRSGNEADIGTAKTDGFATIGVKLALGASYMYFRNSRMAGFSRAGTQLNQTVNVQFNDVDYHNCAKGREWVKNPSTNDPCVASRIYNGYIVGCTSGDYSENGLTDFHFDGVIYEYCGSSGTEAGLRLRAGRGTIRGLYFEANERNYWFTDCLAQQISVGFEGAATNADVRAWSGVAFGDRGYSRQTNRKITIVEIEGDPSVDDGLLRVLSPLGIAGPSTASFAPADGMTTHYKAPEMRVRYEGSTAARAWEHVVGGGGIGGSGWFSIYDATTGAIRMEFEPGTGAAGIRGSDAGMELWLNGARVLTTRRTGWTTPTGTATRTAFDTATATTAQVAERLKALIEDITTMGQIGT